MNGLHLISTSKAGVTIQFYALLLAALLELRFKQACVATYEASQQRPQEPATETQTIPGLMVPPDTLASAAARPFWPP
jgi:hypothetical protein